MVAAIIVYQISIITILVASQTAVSADCLNFIWVIAVVSFTTFEAGFEGTSFFVAVIPVIPVIIVIYVVVALLEACANSIPTAIGYTGASLEAEPASLKCTWWRTNRVENPLRIVEIPAPWSNIAFLSFFPLSVSAASYTCWKCGLKAQRADQQPQHESHLYYL